MAKKKQYWLFKSDPDDFSWQDLLESPDQTACWDGVRNYQARNLIRDEMKEGDRVLFYHSQLKPPVVMGTAVIVKESYPDDTAWEEGNKHFDKRASEENPIWQMVDIQAEKEFNFPVSLPEMRETDALEGMMLLKRGSRLSVQPVDAKHFQWIVKRGNRKKA
ncbi:putative RNA-binding protein, contains PUA-like domain [Planctomycetales bacterium 10988]|nr:putative RNA-binding protein, contains PUA-like domain [Planctomycetales bacterium 10988]